MPRLVQVLIGKIYDAAYEAGSADGFRRGVDEVAKRDEDIYRRMYDEGAHDANRLGSALFLAATCVALHEGFRFGAKRLKRVTERVGDLLIHTLTPSDLVKQCASFGVRIDYDEDIDGMEDDA